MKGANHYRKAEELAETAQGATTWDATYGYIALAHLHLRLAEVAADNADRDGWNEIRRTT